MEKQAEIKIFTEELWANIVMMMVGSELTTADILQALEAIRSRLQRPAAEDGDGTMPSARKS
jgi:hypothetical protein